MSRNVDIVSSLSLAIRSSKGSSLLNKVACVFNKIGADTPGATVSSILGPVSQKTPSSENPVSSAPLAKQVLKYTDKAPINYDYKSTVLPNGTWSMANDLAYDKYDPDKAKDYLGEVNHTLAYLTQVIGPRLERRYHDSLDEGIKTKQYEHNPKYVALKQLYQDYNDAKDNNTLDSYGATTGLEQALNNVLATKPDTKDRENAMAEYKAMQYWAKERERMKLLMSSRKAEEERASNPHMEWRPASPRTFEKFRH